MERQLYLILPLKQATRNGVSSSSFLACRSACLLINVWEKNRSYKKLLSIFNKLVVSPLIIILSAIIQVGLNSYHGYVNVTIPSSYVQRCVTMVVARVYHGSPLWVLFQMFQQYLQQDTQIVSNIQLVYSCF